MTRCAKSSTGAAAPATVVVEIDESYCKGCGLCVAFCEQGALELSPTPNRRGVFVARVVAGSECVGCRRCTLVCPEAALQLYRRQQ